ncbi:hypothetical protein HDU76_008328, partial [Blyttiomyces sp. JEL0837]
MIGKLQWSNKTAMIDAIKKEDEPLFKGILWAIPTEVYETEEWRSAIANILLTTSVSTSIGMFKEVIDRGHTSNPT